MSPTGAAASASPSNEQCEVKYYQDQLQEIDMQIAVLHKSSLFTKCDDELRTLYTRRTDVLNLAARRGIYAPQAVNPQQTVGGVFPDDQSDSESEDAPAGGGFADGSRVVNDEFWTKLGYNLDPSFDAYARSGFDRPKDDKEPARFEWWNDKNCRYIGTFTNKNFGHSAVNKGWTVDAVYQNHDWVVDVEPRVSAQDSQERFFPFQSPT